MTRRIAAAVLLASVLWTTGPSLLALVRQAIELRPLSMRERRAFIFPGSFAPAQNMPPEPLALIARTDAEMHEALFFNYYIYPHPTRLYRRREFYVFAANDPTRPSTTVSFTQGAQLRSYAAIRALEITAPIVRDVAFPAAASRELIVPFAVSADGPPPDMYTVELALRADPRAKVTMTWFPSGVTRSFVLEGTRRFNDVVMDLTSQMGLGWLRITSDEPIHAAAWFVNRGTRAVAPITIFGGDTLPPTPVTFPPNPDAKQWVVNLEDAPADIDADIGRTTLAPHAILSMPPMPRVTTSKRIVTFQTNREPNGGTRFTWPGGVK